MMKDLENGLSKVIKGKTFTSDPLFYAVKHIKRKGDNLRTEQELRNKLKELDRADLDQMVFGEVEYGKFWIRWVLGEHEHRTKTRKEEQTITSKDVGSVEDIL